MPNPSAEPTGAAGLPQLVALALARARGGANAPRTLNLVGPVAPQAVTGAYVAVGGTAIATGVIPIGKRVILTVSVETDAGAGVQDNVQLRICDGAVGVSVADFADTVGNSTIELAEQSTVSWTAVVSGDGLAHTYFPAVKESAPPGITIPALGCSFTVQIVAG
jgi:hypothetical protein